MRPTVMAPDVQAVADKLVRLDHHLREIGLAGEARIARDLAERLRQALARRRRVA